MRSVKFYCCMCGWRYWQVAEDEQDPMATAIRQEAEWHGLNMAGFGQPYPSGAEPVYAALIRLSNPLP